jgi:hypothetical protein
VTLSLSSLGLRRGRREIDHEYDNDTHTWSVFRRRFLFSGPTRRERYSTCVWTEHFLCGRVHFAPRRGLSHIRYCSVFMMIPFKRLFVSIPLFSTVHTTDSTVLHSTGTPVSTNLRHMGRSFLA